jgi:hypothetical protein
MEGTVTNIGLNVRSQSVPFITTRWAWDVGSQALVVKIPPAAPLLLYSTCTPKGTLQFLESTNSFIFKLHTNKEVIRTSRRS